MIRSLWLLSALCLGVYCQFDNGGAGMDNAGGGGNDFGAGGFDGGMGENDMGGPIGDMGGVGFGVMGGAEDMFGVPRGFRMMPGIMMPGM